MTKELERKLEKQARKKGLTGRKKNAYKYGTMNKIQTRRVTKRRRVFTRILKPGKSK